MKFADYINESVLLNDLKKLEKALPKEFKMEEFLQLQYTLGMGYGVNWGKVILPIAERTKTIDKVIISKSAYASMGVWEGENGYADYGTPRKEYMEKWEELYEDEDWETLIKENIQWAKYQGKEDKKLKSIAGILTKGFSSKINAAKYIVKSSSTPGITDGMLVADKWFSERMSKLWYSKDDIYALSYSGRKYLTNSNRTLYDWIQNFGKIS